MNRDGNFNIRFHKFIVTSRKIVPAIRAIPTIQIKTSTHTFSILLRLLIILTPAKACWSKYII